jgi:ATP-dependent DNA helicase RecG
MASGERMGRLLQGDVGSGKTVVAMLAMADAASSAACSRP